MSKTLTVVINNLDEEFIKRYWKDAQKLARKELGIPTSPTEVVQIDAQQMQEEFLEGFSAMMSAISAAHAIATAHKLFNT